MSICQTFVPQYIFTIIYLSIYEKKITKSWMYFKVILNLHVI